MTSNQVIEMQLDALKKCMHALGQLDVQSSAEADAYDAAEAAIAAAEHAIKPSNCHKCCGNSITHSSSCQHYNSEKERAAMAAYVEAKQQ